MSCHTHRLVGNPYCILCNPNVGYLATTGEDSLMSRAGDRYARADRDAREATTHRKVSESRGGRDNAARVHEADKNTSRQDAKEAAKQARGGR